jgi:hypothetical protein
MIEYKLCKLDMFGAIVRSIHRLSIFNGYQSWTWTNFSIRSNHLFQQTKLDCTSEGRLIPSRRREAPCEGTNPPPRLFTPGETKALAKFNVHQWSRAWLTNDGWSSSLISKIWRTVMNSGHWLVQFNVCIITTAWRQRNSKHFLIWWLINFSLANYISFLLAFLQDFVNFKNFLRKKGRKNRLKEGSRR